MKSSFRWGDLPSRRFEGQCPAWNGEKIRCQRKRGHDPKIGHIAHHVPSDISWIWADGSEEGE